MASSDNLPPLNGIRAVANLGVVATHLSFHVLFVADRKFAFDVAFQNLGWLRISMMLALFSMDAFIILTGFLATWHLLPKLQAAHSCADCNASILTYYRTRMLRIIPPYYLFLAIVTFATIPLSSFLLPLLAPDAKAILLGMLRMGPGTCSLPVRFSDWLFLSNLSGQCGCLAWFWNLSVQVQFYALFPWGLLALGPSRAGFKRRLSQACWVLGGLSLLYRFLVLYKQRIMLPMEGLPDYHTYELAQDAVTYYALIHGSLFARVFHLSLGCWLALKVHSRLGLEPPPASALDQLPAAVLDQPAGAVHSSTAEVERAETGPEPIHVPLKPKVAELDDNGEPIPDPPQAARASSNPSTMNKHTERASASMPGTDASGTNTAHPPLPLCSWASFVALLLGLLTLGMMLGKPPPDAVPGANFPVDTLMALGLVLGVICPGVVAYSIYYCIAQPDRIAKALGVVLSSRPLGLLARFSYSTYIVHYHVIASLLVLLPAKQYLDLGYSKVVECGEALEGLEGLLACLGYWVASYSISFVLGAALEKVAGGLVQVLGGGHKKGDAGVLQQEGNASKKML